jgi:hypothetical protein
MISLQLRVLSADDRPKMDLHLLILRMDWFDKSTSRLLKQDPAVVRHVVSILV